MRTLMKANFRNLQKKRPRESENVSPSFPHLEWVLCSVLPVLYFAATPLPLTATSGVCLIRSGAAGFQNGNYNRKKIRS
jgi:hypothetical protein